MVRVLLAVDPGGTTGWATANHDTGVIDETGEMSPYEFECWAEALAQAWEGQLTIVCERFTIDQRTIKLSREGMHDALDQIGTLKYFSRKYCGRPLAMQEVSAKDLFPNKWLKARGWYVTGGGGHANDALRHLAYRLKAEGVISVSGTGT